MLYVEIVAQRMFWKDFDACARMWPAWYYLIGIRATDTFDVRARAARVASWDKYVKTNKLVVL